jgi:hypothetical protein
MAMASGRFGDRAPPISCSVNGRRLIAVVTTSAALRGNVENTVG